MKTGKIFIAVVITLSFSIIAKACFGADVKQLQTTHPAKAEPAKKELTKSEVLDNLKGKLEHNDEVFDMIPELKAQKDSEGKESYTLKGVKLDDLTKEDLYKLLMRVNQAVTKIQTDRIQKQLENIRQAQNAQRMAAPPAPPRIPAAPPSAPRIPPSPPPTPQRR